MLKHPTFYNCPIAIRFKIGREAPMHLDALAIGDKAVNPKYIETV